MNIVYCQSTKLKNTYPSKIFFQITTSTSCGIMPFSLKWFLFSHWVMSDSLRTPGLKKMRFPCPSPSPGVCSNSYPSCRWCHPTISSSVTPTSSCPQSFQASGSFPMSQLIASSGQSIRVSILSFQLILWSDFP